MNQPLVFEPLFKERVWGGRRMETLFGKRLPPGVRIGESWEIVDREEAQSVVHEGELRGATLHELWTKHHDAIFGERTPPSERFPLFFKILDAQERLSVQVHPPTEIAARLGGEPKTEMWYLLNTLLDADLYAGLRPGVGREEFETALKEGRVAEMVHRIAAKPGDALFIPSGRIHAIGAGNVVFEVQQNSDTTYRVFDWNRHGLDGKPRALHVEESLESINFQDYEPNITQPSGECVVECDDFRVEKWNLNAPRVAHEDGFSVFMVLNGTVECAARRFEPGQFFLVPNSLQEKRLIPVNGDAGVLRTTLPQQA